MKYLFSVSFLYTSAPNALWRNGVIAIFFLRSEKKEGIATHKWFMSHNDSQEKKSVLTFTKDNVVHVGYMWYMRLKVAVAF